MRIAPGATAVTPLVFEHYPVSHSLAAVALWAILVGAAYLLLKRDRRGAIVLAALVVSHWLLDAIVHQPDLPLYPGSTAPAGLKAWSSPALSAAMELPIFAAGAWIYARGTRPADPPRKFPVQALPSRSPARLPRMDR